MSPVTPNTNKVDSENLKILRESLAEYRIFFQHITNIYDQLRIKALALIAGEVAILTLIFSSGYNFPSSYYIQLFFYIGCAMLVIAFAGLLWVISVMDWEIPHTLRGSKDMLPDYKDELAFVQFLHDDYFIALKKNSNRITTRARAINFPIYFLLLGVIIILIVKFGG